MLRRTLLILVTGLIVARPLILGEDPGMTSDPTDASSLLLTMFWFVSAALWAAWRLWARQAKWYGGALEACLFAVILLTGLGAAFVAPYKHPARLVAWEWLAMGVGFVLLRQLAVSREEQKYFFAVLLAGAVPLSVYGLYQRGYEIPQVQEKYGSDLDQLRREMEAEQGRTMDDAYLQAFQQRIQDFHVFGTYGHPNNFAGYLSLFVPGLVGAALLCARHKHPRWQVMLAASFATLAVMALWMTHSRGALLGSALAGLIVAAVVWRAWLRQHWGYALGIVAALALLAGAAWQVGVWTGGLGKSEGTIAVRLEYWRNTLKMIREHPWLGVGPGQFGTYYTRYMGESDGETIKDPHNFALEIWATCGIFAMLALLAAFALFYRRTVQALLSAPSVDGPYDLPPPDPRPPELLPVRWEFYVGGMFGLLLAFVLRVTERSQDEIVIEAVKAGVQSVLWFASFALFEQIVWSDRARLLALAAGATAALLNLMVSGGIGAPSVACMLWCVIALAMNSAGATPNAVVGRFRPQLYFTLPVLGTVAVLYMTYVFYPVANSVSQMKHATAKQLGLETQVGNNRLMAGAFANIFSAKDLEPVEKALAEDPDNADLCNYLANRYAWLWANNVNAARRAGIESPSKQIEKALDYAEREKRLDSEGRDAYLLKAELHRRIAEQWELPEDLPGLHPFGAVVWLTVKKARATEEGWAEKRREQYDLAAAALAHAVNHDPNNAQMHYRLADALYLAGRNSEAAPHAERALYLDDKANGLTRKLSKGQRLHIYQWLKPQT
jgi:hypothetical protein